MHTYTILDTLRSLRSRMYLARCARASIQKNEAVCKQRQNLLKSAIKNGWDAFETAWEKDGTIFKQSLEHGFKHIPKIVLNKYKLTSTQP